MQRNISKTHEACYNAHMTQACAVIWGGVLSPTSQWSILDMHVHVYCQGMVSWKEHKVNTITKMPLPAKVSTIMWTMYKDPPLGLVP